MSSSRTPKRSRSTHRTARPAIRSRSARWPAARSRSCPGTAVTTASPAQDPVPGQLWALRSLGVRRVIAPTAVGSLTLTYGPGTLVIPDQLVDRTRPAADLLRRGRLPRPVRRPVLPFVRAPAIATGPASRLGPVEAGTLVVIEGPRFSTRAESLLVRRPGLDPGRHDRTPRGRPGPRARPVLRAARPGHRPGRWPRPRARASPRPRSSRSSRPTSPACATWSPRSSPPSPPTARTTSAPTPWTASTSPSPSPDPPTPFAPCAPSRGLHLRSRPCTSARGPAPPLAALHPRSRPCTPARAVPRSHCVPLAPCAPLAARPSSVPPPRPRPSPEMSSLGYLSRAAFSMRVNLYLLD